MYEPRRFAPLMLAAALALLAGCATTTPGTVTLSYSEITVDQLHQRLQRGEDLLIVDVRSPEKYTGELGHIPGAVLRPLPEIKSWMGEIRDRGDGEVFLVCRSGTRSEMATSLLARRGFRAVNVIGGMKAWNRKGYPVER